MLVPPSEVNKNTNSNNNATTTPSDANEDAPADEPDKPAKPVINTIPPTPASSPPVAKSLTSNGYFMKSAKKMLSGSGSHSGTTSPTKPNSPTRSDQANPKPEDVPLALRALQLNVNSTTITKSAVATIHPAMNGLTVTNAPLVNGPNTGGSRSPSSPDDSGVESDTHSNYIVSPSASNPPSRAPSIISRSSKSDKKANKTDKQPVTPTAEPGAGQRFTLKDLRASSGGKSGGGSSKKSDGAESTTGSLSKKYGVCERVAIGKGATSVVKLAHKWDRSVEKLYAVKEFRKRRKTETEKEYVKKLTSEFCISSTLQHINVVETVDLVQDDQHNWCEVMEYCPGGDLYAVIKKGGMSEGEVECCFKMILLGVGYLHSQGVAHRDIKPENLFFDARGHLKIGDYGASTVYRLPWESAIHMSTGLCGSAPYIAPEQFAATPYDARLVDIWACGIVYYCLHFQELPWRVAQLSDELYKAYHTAIQSAPTPAQSNPSSNPTASTNFPPPISNLSPRVARPLLRRMLEPDPKQRILIEDVLKFPWIKGIEACSELYGTGKTPNHTHGSVKAMAAANGFVV